MTHLEAFALKATGTTPLLAVRAALGLTGTGARPAGRFVGLTGENPEERTTWIHVGYEGEWEGHPSGPFQLTREAFAQCIAAFRSLSTPPQIDYGHGSLYETDGQPKPAAGYVVDLELRDDGLWACAELTPRAADHVRAGEYRFCSGVFAWDQPDRVTGEPIPCQLDSIGLTNRPFIDGQQAIRLSRVAALGASPMEIKKTDLMAKLDALVKGSTVTAQELEALVQYLRASEAPAEPPSGEVEIEASSKPAEDKPADEKPKPEDDKAAMAKAVDCSAPPAPAAALAEPAQMDPGVIVQDTPAIEADAGSMLLTKIAELTGLDTASIVASMDANADRIKSAFLGGDGGSIPYQALAAKVPVLETTVTTLTAELERYRADERAREDAKIVGEVDGLVSCGKALPSQREHLLTLARKSPGEFRALASTMPVIVPMGRDTPREAPRTAANSLGKVDADAMPKDHPRYLELSRSLSDPRNPFSALLPKDGAEREAAIDRMVRSQIKNEQPLGG